MHLCTRARISQCVERDYLWSERRGGGMGERPLSRAFELFRAREVRIFNLAGADLIYHTAATRQISRFLAKTERNSSPRENRVTRCLLSNSPEIILAAFQARAMFEIAEESANIRRGFSLSATTGAGAILFRV